MTPMRIWIQEPPRGVVRITLVVTNANATAFSTVWPAASVQETFCPIRTVRNLRQRKRYGTPNRDGRTAVHRSGTRRDA